MLRRAVTASFVFLAFTALSFAQGKPNFSGTWKLNTAKSDFGPLPRPDTRTDVIEHADPALKISVSSTGAQGAQNYVVNLTTDGKEATNSFGPNPAKSTATWDGNKLQVNTNLKFNDQDVAIKSIWTLSPDGKTLTLNTHFTSPMGEADQTLIYDKQDGGAPAMSQAPAATPAQTPTMTPAMPAGGKPNLSGTWKLNVAKSDFGPIPGPTSQTDTIEHNDPLFKVHTVQSGGPQGDQDMTLSFTTDGKEVTNSIQGNDIKTITLWEGGNLTATSKLKIQDQDIGIKGVYVLSPDGKTLTENVHFTSPMGEGDQKLVFDKTDAGPAAMAPPMPKTTPTMPGSGGHPNFSGVWKLNTAKSDFGVMPGPDVRTDTIEHNEPLLKFARNENGPDGPREYVLTMTTDGKETVNHMGPVEAKVSANWEGPGLIINLKLKLQDQDIAIRQVAMLSPDGNTMTNKAHVTMSLGEMDQVEVYDRQP